MSTHESSNINPHNPDDFNLNPYESHNPDDLNLNLHEPHNSDDLNSNPHEPNPHEVNPYPHEPNPHEPHNPYELPGNSGSHQRIGSELNPFHKNAPEDYNTSEKIVYLGQDNTQYTGTILDMSYSGGHWVYKVEDQMEL